MNIFLAGIHGVGKTYLANQLPRELGLKHTSASQLIKEERTSASWGKDKRVAQVDENQLALMQAVRRHNRAGKRLLLDGHFVLLDIQGAYVRLGKEVFESLDLDGVVLLEADPALIGSRTFKRDQVVREESDIAAFMEAEHRQALAVCKDLEIPLEVLDSAEPDIFLQVVGRLLVTNGIERS